MTNAPSDGDVDNGEAVRVWGQGGVHGKSLYLPSPFVCEPETTLKSKV